MQRSKKVMRAIIWLIARFFSITLTVFLPINSRLHDINVITVITPYYQYLQENSARDDAYPSKSQPNNSFARTKEISAYGHKVFLKEHHLFSHVFNVRLWEYYNVRLLFGAGKQHSESLPDTRSTSQKPYVVIFSQED